MNIRTCIGLWRRVVGPCICSVVLLAVIVCGVRAEECIPDEVPPLISITSPAAGGGHYNAEEAVVNLSGEFRDDRGVTRVDWSNDRGGTGTVRAAITDWDGPWHWEAMGIGLEEGENVITVTARDAAGNAESASLTVTYAAPSVRGLENRKAKFTFFFDSDGIDRFSIYTYLAKDINEVFEMPFDKDVTVSVTVPDPGNPDVDLQLFTQTVPAGAVTGLAKYRYRSAPGGIRELLFQNATSTRTYMYGYVEGIDLLPGIKPSLSTEDYWAFIRSIGSYTITVQIDDMIWSGQAPLVPGYYSVHKQELVYNR